MPIYGTFFHDRFFWWKQRLLAPLCIFNSVLNMFILWDWQYLSDCSWKYWDTCALWLRSTAVRCPTTFKERLRFALIIIILCIPFISCILPLLESDGLIMVHNCWWEIVKCSRRGCSMYRGIHFRYNGCFIPTHSGTKYDLFKWPISDIHKQDSFIGRGVCDGLIRVDKQPIRAGQLEALKLQFGSSPDFSVVPENSVISCLQHPKKPNA